jgi:hypothetical protein
MAYFIQKGAENQDSLKQSSFYVAAMQLWIK